MGITAARGSCGKMKIDVYPVYRTLACASVSQYNTGRYRPYGGKEGDQEEEY